MNETLQNSKYNASQASISSNSLHPHLQYCNYQLSLKKVETFQSSKYQTSQASISGNSQHSVRLAVLQWSTDIEEGWKWNTE